MMKKTNIRIVLCGNTPLEQMTESQFMALIAKALRERFPAITDDQLREAVQNAKRQEADQCQA